MSAHHITAQRLTRFTFAAIAAAMLTACQDNTAPASPNAASVATSASPSLSVTPGASRGIPSCSPLCAVPRMLFTRFWNGGPHVFRMNSDGSNVTLIGQGSEAAWSPNYQKIVFIKGASKDVHVMNADGTNVVQLTFTGDEERKPTWSPDGTKIAYQRNLGTNAEIYVMNANGTAQTRLTYSSGWDIQPAWAPNGNKIAFSHSQGTGADIMVMNVDGSAQTALTGPGQAETAPAWSPDGSKIAYQVATGGCAIAMMNADGSNQTILYPNPGTDTCASPTFNVSGTHLAYTSYAGLPPWHGSIYSLNLTSGLVSQLTSGRNSDTNPAWSRQ